MKRALAVIAALGVVGAAAAAVALKTLLPPDKIRTLAISGARKALGRDVALERVTVGLVSGLSLKKLAVSEAGGFGAGTFASVESFSLKVRWAPLLKKRVVIDSVAAEGLVLRLLKKKDGTYNASTLASQGGSGETGAGVELAVRRLDVADARLVYEEEGSDRRMTLSGLDARVAGFAASGAFSARLSGRAEGVWDGKPVEGRAAFKGAVDLGGSDPRRVRVQAESLEAASAGWSVKLSGSASDLSAPVLDVKLQAVSPAGPLGEASFAGKADRVAARLTGRFRADVPGLDPKSAAQLGVPGGAPLPAFKAEGELRYGGDGVAVDTLVLKTEAGRVEGHAAVTDLSSAKRAVDADLSLALELPGLKSEQAAWLKLPAGVVLPATKLSGKVKLKGDVLELADVSVAAPGTQLLVESGRVSGLGTASPEVSFLVKCRKFLLEELAAVWPPARELGLKGSGLFALAVSGKLPKPVLEGKLQFKELGATVSGLTLAGFTGTASFTEKRLDIPNLRGQVGEGELAMDLTVKNYATAPDVDLQASLTVFDLGKFLSAQAASKREPAKASKPGEPLSARGKLDVGRLIHPNAETRDLRLRWDLEGITPGLESLGGTAQISAAGGKFTNLAAMAGGSKVVKVLLFPLLIVQKIGTLIKVLPNLNDIRFDEITGDYAFKAGMMTLRDSRLHGSDVNVSMTGTIDLPGEKPDVVVTAKVGPVAPVDVEVKGTFDKPVTRLKVAKILTDTGKRLLEGLLKR